jgi:hypothetical protein
MSANMVGDSHIHFMVNAGLALPQYESALRWFVRDLTDEEKAEGYQRGAAWGPGAMEIFGRLRRELTKENAGWVGAMLLAENRRSVDHRYGEEEWEQPYEFRRLPGTPDPVAVLKAIHGFAYHACEHPEWQGSEAHKFCDSLQHTAIQRLAGYEDAPWEVKPLDLMRLMR